jgi:Raf kinase inhibitor-like YbhB/YbcL family protein
MRSTRLFPVLLLAVITFCPVVCVEGAPMFTLTSSAFAAGQQIPKKYTCEGDDRSPPLAWSGAPSGTKSFALIVDDPDAPDPKAPRMTWVHWVLYNIPGTTAALAEGSSSGALPAGAIESRNDFGRVRFGGPCPPIGRHRYFHKLYALDTPLPADKPLDKAALESAMKGHVLAQAELMGTYQKGDK